jgi:hypothetical protein
MGAKTTHTRTEEDALLQHSAWTRKLVPLFTARNKESAKSGNIHENPKNSMHNFWRVVMWSLFWDSKGPTVEHYTNNEIMMVDD